MNPETIKKFIETSRATGVADDKIVSYLKNKGIDLSTGEVVVKQPEEPSVQVKPSAFDSFATGVAKGELSTIKGTGGLLQYIGQSVLAGVSTGAKKLVGVDTSFVQEKQKIEDTTGFKSLQKGTPEEIKVKEFLQPKTTAESVGFGVEKVAEFLIPATKIKKAQTAVDTLVAGTNMPNFAKAVTRVLGKAGVEALGAGGVSLAQTGEFKEAGKTALFAGALKTATGAVGETLKSFKLPERLYSRIFKESADEAIAQIDNEVRAGLKVSNPLKYNDYVSKGIIDPVTDRVNKSLAKEALDRGLKGSVTNMTKQTVANTWDLEDQARNLVKGKPVVVESKSRLISTLKELAKDWKDVEDGSMSKQASSYVKLLQSGSIDGEDALKLRRFLDGMRIKSSFNPSVKLSQTQANYKYWADAVRKTLAKIPGVSDTMKEYSFNIEALMALGKEAARQNNRQVLGLIDSVFLGSGIATGMPIQAGILAGTRRLLGSAGVSTKIGQAIQNSGISTKTGIAAKGFVGSQF